MLERLLSTADSYMPEGLDPVRCARARIIVISAWFLGGLALIALMSVVLQEGDWPPRRTLVLASLVPILTAPHLLRYTASVQLAGWVVVCFAAVASLIAAYNNGGIAGFSNPVMPVLPILVATLSGVRAAVRFSIVLGLALVGLFLLEGSLPEPYVALDGLPHLRLLMLLMAMVVAVACAALFVFIHQRLREEAERAQVAAEAASEAKSRFLANMGHELRTPLNGVLGFSQLLLEGGIRGEQRSHVEAIRSSGGLLLQILDDVLDLSQLDRKDLELRRETFSLRELLADKAQLLHLLAEAKGLEVTLQVAPEVPDGCVGDRHRLSQVLVKLFGNAVKFTEVGGISVEVSQREGRTHVVVQDTGIGVPEEARARIFERFAQADGSISRRFGGTGVGLALCRGIVTQLGGRIWLEPSAVGARFCFEVPLEPAALSTPETLTPARPEGLRVLVAEDNPVNQQLMRRLLERDGHEVVIAPEGRTAVRAASSERFDAILMDLQMPVLDGLGATREIRSGGPNSETLIIAVTAAAGDAPRAQCEAAGIDEFLTKPASPAAIRGALMTPRPSGGRSSS